MLPSATDISHFLVIAERKNLSRASESIGVSQPSLSQGIKRLEDAIGTKLLVRSKRGVELTQAGRQFHSQARQLLEQWSEVKKSALASVNEIQGIFTLGCHPSVARYSLGLFLPKLMKDHPKLEIKLVHELSRRITEKIISLEVDIGIVVNPVQHPDLIIQKLCKDEVTFWESPIHPATGVLICDPDLIQVQSLLKKPRGGGIRFDRIIPSSNLEVVAQLVQDGVGSGILPSRVAKTYGSGKLRKIPGAPTFQDEICLVYRSEKKNIQAIQAIRKKITEAFN